jgi:hypothetical protein
LLAAACVVPLALCTDTDASLLAEELLSAFTLVVLVPLLLLLCTSALPDTFTLLLEFTLLCDPLLLPEADASVVTEPSAFTSTLLAVFTAFCAVVFTVTAVDFAAATEAFTAVFAAVVAVVATLAAAFVVALMAALVLAFTAALAATDALFVVAFTAALVAVLTTAPICPNEMVAVIVAIKRVIVLLIVFIAFVFSYKIYIQYRFMSVIPRLSGSIRLDQNSRWLFGILLLVKRCGTT